MTEIPDGETLYRYAKPDAFPEGQEEVPASIFNDPKLSCDWEKYQKEPDKSYHIEEGKTVIVSIAICDEIRNPTNPKRTGQVVPDWKQEIVHAPIKAEDDPVHGENYSHSLINGTKKAAVTQAISKNSKWRKSN